MRTAPRQPPAPRRAPPREGSARSLPALLACLVWVAGFEAAPLLHVAQHAALAPHHHGALHAHDGSAPHRHHDEERAPDSPEHGEGSLLHRGVAAHAAPPALPPIDPPWWVSIVPRFEAPPAPATLDPAPRRARGPPRRA